MSELNQNWEKVVDAFSKWWLFETNDFGPQIQYLSKDELLKFTQDEMIDYVTDLRDHLLAKRLEQLDNCRLAIGDVLSVISGPEYLDVLQSMLDILDNLDDLFKKFSDLLSTLIDAIREKDFDEVTLLISELLDIETEVRHYMSIFPQGFNKLEALGLASPDFI